MITAEGRLVISTYMNAVCERMTLGATDIAGQVTTPEGEVLTALEANHKYGQLLNTADDAMREMLSK